MKQIAISHSLFDEIFRALYPDAGPTNYKLPLIFYGLSGTPVLAFIASTSDPTQDPPLDEKNAP